MLVITNILLLIIAVFSIWSVYSLYGIKKKVRNRRAPSDEGYIDLKYKLQFITSIGVVIVGVVGFLGYDKFESIAKEVSKLDSKLKVADEKLKATDNKLKEADIKIQKYDSDIKTLEVYSNRIATAVQNSNGDLGKLNQTIANIREKNVLDKNFYFIENLSIRLEQTSVKLHFKDMVTSLGDRLPAFKSAPTIIVAPVESGAFMIAKTTSEYVEISYTTYYSMPDGSDPSELKFTLIISKKE